MNQIIKGIVKKYSPLLSNIYYCLMNNRVSGRRGNTFKHQNAFIKGMRLSFYGKGNSVVIGGERPASLSNCHIAIHGNNNRVIIEGGVGTKDLTIYCGNENCLVYVKEDAQFAGKTELAVMEGTKIEVGRDCLFSANITLRAGDSHSVIDAETGTRINKSKDIIIGDHVWIGNTVIITKGTVIEENSVVATGAVVAGKTYPRNSAIAGNPAKVVKEGINWIA